MDSAKSAFKVMYGLHDFNANPFAPLGCAVKMHVTPAKCRLREELTETDWFIGNTWNHYRCHKIWIKDTKKTKVGQTVFFRHKYLTQPIVTPTDAILRATEDLCKILQNKEPVKGEARAAIDMLVDIFKGHTPEMTKPGVQRAETTKAAEKKREAEQQEDEIMEDLNNRWQDEIDPGTDNLLNAPGHTVKHHRPW